MKSLWKHVKILPTKLIEIDINIKENASTFNGEKIHICKYQSSSLSFSKLMASYLTIRTKFYYVDFLFSGTLQNSIFIILFII